MAKVTYRGVEYDSEEYNAKIVAEAAKRERHDLMYRGLKVKSKASPCSQRKGGGFTPLFFYTIINKMKSFHGQRKIKSLSHGSQRNR